MLNRNVSLALCLSVIAGAAFAQSNQGTGYIFEFATASGASGQFQGFTYNTASLGTPAFSATGPTGSNQVVAKPDGSKFYVVGSGGVDDFNPTFTTPLSLNGISGSIGQVIISPDGRFLLIASTMGSGTSAVYILNTTTDSVVMNQAISGSVYGMVVSHDSKTAWILGESSQTFIVTINLTTQQQIGSPVVLRDPVTGNSLGGNAQALTLSPFGLLYVSAGNQILEMDPATLQTVSPTYVEISVNATAGPLQFSTDGAWAYFINLAPQFGGQSLLRMALPTPATPSASGHTVISWPPFVAGQQPEVFDSIVIAGGTSTGAPQRLFAHSPNDSTLWDVAPDFSTVGVSALNGILPATSVVSIALSNEIPSARYLYTLVGSGTQASIYRVDLTTNAVTSQASAALGIGTLQFSIVPPETNPTSFITYDALQTNLAAGAKALPLIARVLDPVGRPMFAVPVTFTGDPSLIWSGGTAIAGGVSLTSNEDGYVQTTVTMGTASEAPGSYPVTLTAGNGTNVATATFSLTIPGGVTGPTNGPNQMTIINGNGQLFRAQNPNFGTTSALTIQLLDTNGSPLVNQNVAFTLVGPHAGIAVLDNPSATTDQYGMASTDFFPQGIAQNVGFQGVAVTAVAAQGSVTFNETVWQPDSNNEPVSATVLVPTGSQTITAGEGERRAGRDRRRGFALRLRDLRPDSECRRQHHGRSGQPRPGTLSREPPDRCDGNSDLRLRRCLQHRDQPLHDVSLGLRPPWLYHRLRRVHRQAWFFREHRAGLYPNPDHSNQRFRQQSKWTPGCVAAPVSNGGGLRPMRHRLPGSARDLESHARLGYAFHYHHGLQSGRNRPDPRDPWSNPRDGYNRRQH